MELKSKRAEYLKLLIFLGILFLILGGFLLYVSIPLLGNKTAVLATQPVDPFDLVRGQYIVIRYEIGSIPLVDGVEVGDYIYVSLLEDFNGTSRYNSASSYKPSKNDLFIKGQVKSIYGNDMQVEYGIEQYFFERGAVFDTGEMEVRVKLSNNGVARIVELLHDGKPIEITYKNKTLTS